MEGRLKHLGGFRQPLLYLPRKNQGDRQQQDGDKLTRCSSTAVVLPV